MAEAIVTFLIEQLASIALQSLEEEVSLVKNAKSDVKKLKRNLLAIQAVLEDAEKKQLTDLSVKLWLERLKEASFEMDNVLDEWNTAVLELKIQRDEDNVDDHQVMTNKKVCFSISSLFTCFGTSVNRLALRYDIAHKIKDMNQTLAEIASEKDQFRLSTVITEKPLERPSTTSFIDETEVVGRDVDKGILVSKLLGETSTQQDKGLQIIPIVGMGGLGKTTLAQLAYKDEEVIAHFDLRIWVCVSDPFDEFKVAKGIIEAIQGSAPNVNELESLLQRIVRCMNKKKFLLVLDDVWTKDQKKWDQLGIPLKSAGSEGSRIIVTTRKEEVAIMMGAKNNMIALERLSEEYCWLMFKRLAFSEREDEERDQLEEIGRKIASKSKGLPLVAKSLGGLMRFKKTKSQWEDILCSDLWSLKDVKEIYTSFLLGYYDLSAKEKQCFSYCSIFPKDHVIEKDQLIKMWMSQNYLSHEKEGVECFENLAMRSFFQNFARSLDGTIVQCKMHDIVHDFTQFLTENECVTVEVDRVEGELKPPHEKAHHLTLVAGSSEKFPPINYDVANERNLRTLFLVPNTNFAYFSVAVDFSLFQQLTCLRSLTLADCGIKNLPSSVGNLKHLRYLDLSYNLELEELPETVCNLCNLQTLYLIRCSLRKLPHGIGKLRKLRHLHLKCSCDELEGLPKGIGKLMSLRSLDTMILAENKDMFFNIQDLKRLRDLQLEGSLHILKCDDLESGDLKNISQRVSELTLDFVCTSESVNKGKDSTVLEGLELNSKLENLRIENFMGTVSSPRWTSSLLNLREIFLNCWSNCDKLPCLGKLPCLEKIYFYDMDAVKEVGLEFLGISPDDCFTSRVTLFPKLKTLDFTSMRKWEKWEGVDTASSSSLVSIMPCLASLRLYDCCRLKVLPNFLKSTTSLKVLDVERSVHVEEWCTERSGNEWDKISHVPTIKAGFWNVYFSVVDSSSTDA